MKKHVLYYFLLVLFAVIFIGSGAGIVYKLAARSRAEAQIEDLKSVFTQKTENQNPAQNSGASSHEQEFTLTLDGQMEARKDRLSGYEKLHARNSEMVGWIEILGTEIDYPVMQSKDRPDFYLKHGFDEAKSSYGTPYVAELCDLESGEGNIIIYGHHMKDGTMFGGLKHYIEESYYESHPVIWFDTLEQPGAYQIIAVMKASVASDGEGIFALAADNTKRQEFLDAVRCRSFYDTGQTADTGEPLLILITCEYTQKEGRLLVVAGKCKQS